VCERERESEDCVCRWIDMRINSVEDVGYVTSCKKERVWKRERERV